MSRAKPIRKRARTPARGVQSKAKTDITDTRTVGSVRRKTGIRVMGDMPWGSHICVFYETNEDLCETNAEYFQAGLESNELCVWASPTRQQWRRRQSFCVETLRLSTSI